MAGTGQTLTRESYDRLNNELEDLKKQRAVVSQDIKEAREQGDLRENFAYHDAKNAQGLLEARIALVEGRLMDAQIMEAGETIDKVIIGIPVKVRRGGEDRIRVYTIVSEDELDQVDNGATADSAIGQALLGQKAGSKVEVQGPNGPIVFEILEIG